MYNNLLNEDPYIQEREALAKTQGIAEGEARGEVKGLQRAVVTVIKSLFPQLAELELAQQQISQVSNPDILNLLIGQFATAPNEDMARWLIQFLASRNNNLGH